MANEAGPLSRGPAALSTFVAALLGLAPPLQALTAPPEPTGPCSLLNEGTEPGGWQPWGHVEYWIRPPGTGDRLLGHVRLVVDGWVHERTTRSPFHPDDRPRAVRYAEASRALMAARPVPGRRVRSRFEPSTGGDSVQGWPYQRVCLPVSEAQWQRIRSGLFGVFGTEGEAEIHDEGFRYLRDNCVTFPSHLLADALRAAPSARPGEKALVRILAARPATPRRLGRRLRAWWARYGMLSERVR